MVLIDHLAGCGRGDDLRSGRDTDDPQYTAICQTFASELHHPCMSAAREHHGTSFFCRVHECQVENASQFKHQPVFIGHSLALLECLALLVPSQILLVRYLILPTELLLAQVLIHLASAADNNENGMMRA